MLLLQKPAADYVELKTNNVYNENQGYIAITADIFLFILYLYFYSISFIFRNLFNEVQYYYAFYIVSDNSDIICS